MKPSTKKIDSDTSISSRHVHFSWRIKNFSSCTEHPEQVIESENVIMQDNRDKYKWYIRLHPHGATGTSEYISVYLVRSSERGNHVKTSIKLAFHDVGGRKLNVLLQKIDKKDEKIWGWSEFAKREDIVPYLTRDILIVDCWLNLDLEYDVRYGGEMLSLDADDQLRNDFNQLLINENFSDVTLLMSDGTKFSAHKCVLGARSSVFHATFQHDMKENRESTIEIDDIDSNTFKSLLTFIYTGKFEEEKCNNVGSLLAAADKYALDGLVNICELEICKNLKIENVAEYLLLADRHSSTYLKTESINFIILHLKDVFTADALKKVKTEQPLLFEDILREIASRK